MANTQVNTNAVITQMFEVISDVGRTHPWFYSQFEDTDVDTASQEELKDLIASTPVESIKYFLLGKLSMRLAIDVVTGRG